MKKLLCLIIFIALIMYSIIVFGWWMQGCANFNAPIQRQAGV